MACFSHHAGEYAHGFVLILVLGKARAKLNSARGLVQLAEARVSVGQCGMLATLHIGFHSDGPCFTCVFIVLYP